MVAGAPPLSSATLELLFLLETSPHITLEGAVPDDEAAALLPATEAPDDALDELAAEDAPGPALDGGAPDDDDDDEDAAALDESALDECAGEDCADDAAPEDAETPLDEEPNDDPPDDAGGEYVSGRASGRQPPTAQRMNSALRCMVMISPDEGTVMTVPQAACPVLHL